MATCSEVGVPCDHTGAGAKRAGVEAGADDEEEGNHSGAWAGAGNV